MHYTLLFNDIIHYLFVFVRLSAMMILLPGFGEVFVPARVRLMMAFVLTLVISPLVMHSLPEADLISTQTVVYIVRETIIGLFLGAIARIFLNALQLTANVFGMQSSLSSATMFNPSLNTQDSVFSNLLILGATAIIFATNTHYLLIQALINSYEVFSPADAIPFDDISKFVVNALSESFWIGVKLSAPVLIVGTLISASAGLLNRLMPQLQVYFMIMPLQIGAGFILMALTIALILSSFIDAFHIFLRGFE